MPLRGEGTDPCQGFRFIVEVAGMTGKSGFQTVSGLGEESEEATYREGTDALTQHKFPGLVTYSDVELSDGVSTDNSILKWRMEVIDIEKSGAGAKPHTLPLTGASKFRRDVNIYLYNQAGDLIKGWRLKYAWPKALNYDDLDATSSDILMRTLVIAHEGLIVTNGTGSANKS